MAAAAWVFVSCADFVPCERSDDCPLGFFCDAAEGRCDAECFSVAECPEPPDARRRAICTDSGLCSTRARLPRLFIDTPSPGAEFSVVQTTAEVTGRVVAADDVEVELVASGDMECAGRTARVTLLHPEPGRLLELPFVGAVDLPPRLSSLLVSASVRSADRSVTVQVAGSCESCPLIRINEPTDSGISSLILPSFSGTLDPATDSVGVWRVSGPDGQVFDGPLEAEAGVFRVEDLPLFAGANDVQAVVGGGRCSTVVVAPAEVSDLRLLLTWDNTSDLDIILVGPSGDLAAREGLLSALDTPSTFSGQVDDDFNGFGPESLTASELAPGTYGIAVEVTSSPVSGASPFLRILSRGRLLRVPGVGPRFLSAERGEVWLAALLDIGPDGDARLQLVDRVVQMSPTGPPALW